MSQLIHVSDELSFSLANQRISYVFRVSPEGILEHVHFGGYIDPTTQASAGPRRAFRSAALEFQGVQNYNLDDTPQEYPLYGTSDSRYPAMHATNGSGNTTNVLLYKSHQIRKDKPQLPGLPSARGGDSETLIVSLADELSGIQAELSYTVYQDHDVIARSVQISNVSDSEITLHNALSSSLDLPNGEYEILHLKGTWAREFNAQRLAVPHGRFVIESSRGTSSNVHNPFVAIMPKTTSEQHGDVVGTALMYSGSFAINVEKNEFESVRVSAGINPFNFQWKLNAGETFTCPEVLHVFSPQGLDGMSQVWHGFIKARISPPQFVGVTRPSYLNSWEAAYFDVNEDVVLVLADKAKSLGLEMLVLDDGWFTGRDDDTSSLGDWFSDKRKFPQGVEATAKRVQEKGLKFGLWFEPEMVNTRSQLYRDHPDWIIHVPQRALSTGRHQHILDLSRPEVIGYLFERIDSFLSSGHIDYVKWDMNRSMTEIGSAGLPASQQLETPHRYMLGLYDLLKRITQRYPQVLFENCASGGNRFDLGMLRYMSQGWVSDMSEPIGRLPIINGASLLFPPCVLASYIGPVPGHQNGRDVSLKTRTEVGFFCAARGLSINVQDMDADQDALRDIVALYKDSADDLVNGSFHRLKYTQNEVCWQLSSKDSQRVYVGYFHIIAGPNLPFRRAKLVALDPSSRYQQTSNGQIYGADSLMRLGIDLPYVDAMQQQSNYDYANHMPKGDFSSRLMVFHKVS
ncbi:MAG: alpha-galactosidase [Cryomorphaceae bacterium]|jgi:alpha-galactosidase